MLAPCLFFFFIVSCHQTGKGPEKTGKSVSSLYASSLRSFPVLLRVSYNAKQNALFYVFACFACLYFGHAEILIVVKTLFFFENVKHHKSYRRKEFVRWWDAVRRLGDFSMRRYQQRYVRFVVLAAP